MAQDGQRPIIIKKVDGGSGDGHHGGAWKIAYADFVTAMMAFFLLMWLLSITTEERRKGIAEYFNPMADKSVKMPTDAMLEVKPSPLTGGSKVKTVKDGKSEALEKVSDHNNNYDKNKSNTSLDNVLSSSEDSHKKVIIPAIVPIGGPDTGAGKKIGNIGVNDSDKVEEEQKKIEKMISSLEEGIENNNDIKYAHDNLYLKFSRNDIRIELRDSENRSMFDLGSFSPNALGKKMLTEIAAWLSSIPENISVIGHTDRVPYRMGKGWSMSNWTLSTLRADHAREILVQAGYPDGHILDVSGKADRDLAVADDPTSPANRRIVIVIHRRYVASDESGRVSLTPSESNKSSEKK